MPTSRRFDFSGDLKEGERVLILQALRDLGEPATDSNVAAICRLLKEVARRDALAAKAGPPS